MRGSVIKKGTRWYVKIELDPDVSTGRRRQKWHSGYRTKREAERARIDLLARFDRGEYVEPSRQSLEAFLEEWLHTIAPTVRSSTLDSYARNMRNHVIAHIGAMRLTRVDAGVLNGLYAELLASGRLMSSRTGSGYSSEVLERAQSLRAAGESLAATAEVLRSEFVEADHITKDTLASLLRRSAARGARCGDPGLAPRTVAYVHTIAHRALKDAVRWGRLARNPADAADPPRPSGRATDVSAWTAEQLRTFLNRSRADGDRYYALWVLLATTGMRRGEALGIRWSDVDLDAGRARVVQTITQTRSRIELGQPKTASGRRAVALDPGTVAVMRDHRRTMLEERLLVGPDFVDNGFMFHQPDGHCLRPDAVSAAFLRRAARHGLPRLTLHGLRHTWATLALERGIHPKVVQERLGHSSIAITLGIYSHVAPTMHREAADLVATLLFESSRNSNM